MLLNSEEMTIELPIDKRVRIRDMLVQILSKNEIKIQRLEECIGILVAACPAIAYGWLYYKEPEIIKQNALVFNNFNSNKMTVLSN